MTVFGSIITGKMVRDAVTNHIQTWAETYLSEIASLHGRPRGSLPVFRSYVPALEMDAFQEDQIPSCVIVAPGLLTVPWRTSAGFNVRWGVGVGCVVSGQDRNNTLELAEMYASAIRSLMLQHQSFGGFTQGVTWVNERYDDLNTDDMRTIAAGIVQFGIDVLGVIDPTAGPIAPVVTDDPPADWPTVDTVVITTTQERIA